MKAITIFNSDASSSLQIHANTGTPTYLVNSITGLEYPGLRTVTIERGGEHGAYTPISLYGPRLVSITGACLSDTSATFEDARRDLEQILAIEHDINGYVLQKTIKFTTMDDVLLQLPCTLASPLVMPITVPNFTDFTINLVSDYALESQTLSAETFSSPSGGGAIVPFVVPVTLAASSGSSKTVTNAGTVEAWPTITFAGPLTNPVLSNTTVGFYFGLTQTLASGDVVVASMRDHTCVLNTSTNNIANKKVNSEWWWLAPGANTVTLGTSNSSDAGSVLLSWRSAYAGV